jgi:hypothetical protein
MFLKNPSNFFKKTKFIFYLIVSYSLILLTVYSIHINFFRVDVLLYSAIFDAIIALFILGLIALVKKNELKILNHFELFLTLIICIQIGYIYAISIPTVIDRSLSFYLLEKIYVYKGIKEENLREVISNEYMSEFKVPEMRITEQINSGTIFISNGCIELTKKGEMIAKFSSFYRKKFLPKKRLVMNSYTETFASKYSVDKKNTCTFYKE